jgi:glycosyltransferase involved in cell wall biosynthesis
MTPTRPGVGQAVRTLLGIKLGRLAQFRAKPLAHYAVVSPERDDHAWQTFAIVTPSYNQAQFIGRTVESVLGQGCPRLEYIIQDACSTDGTDAVLASLSNPDILVRIEADDGQADAINRGFVGTRGEIMAYLNSDDLLLQGTLGAVAAYFASNPQVDAVYGDRLIIDENDAVVGHWRVPYHDGWVMRAVDYVPQETLFWRRRAWDAVGGYFDTSLHFAMDWDFLLRLQAAGMRIEHLPRFLGAFRTHSLQKTIANSNQGRREMRLLRHRHSSGRTLLLAQLRHLWFLVRHVFQDVTDPV